MAKPADDTNSLKRMAIGVLPSEPDVGDSSDDNTDLVPVLVFEVDGTPYAIGVENTEGVVDCPRITPLPSAPQGIAGVTGVRGKMTVVMDLGPRPVDETTKRRLILVRGDAQMGLLADRVEGVVALEPKRVRPIAHGKERLTDKRARFRWPARNYFKSGTRRVPIIDVERLTEM